MKEVLCKPQEYVTSAELAVFLNVSVRTVEKHSYRIDGRTKIGRSVRYHFPTIKQNLIAGKDLFAGKNAITAKKRVARR